MPRTKEIQVYKLTELEGKAKDHALDQLGRFATDFDWWDHVYEDARTIGSLMGLEIQDIEFSGFSSQGDGASFTGSYGYKSDAVPAVLGHAPQDNELHRIVNGLEALQDRHTYNIHAFIRRGRGGNYVHSRMPEIEVTDQAGDPITEADDKAVSELLRDYMNWIYRQLEAEYEYRTSEEALIEDAEANDWEFDASGDLA